MTDKAFRIKTMTRSELDLAIAWAAQEGWSPGVHDADSYYKADPNGFLIGYLAPDDYLPKRKVDLPDNTRPRIHYLKRAP